jgi:hypothetical protein
MKEHRLEPPLLLAVMIGGLLLGWATGTCADTSDILTLQDNDWRYSEIFINSPALRETNLVGISEFRDPNGVNHLIQDWWWYRSSSNVAGTREFGLSNQTSFTQVSPRRINMTYREPTGDVPNALEFQFDYTLSARDARNANLAIVWTIKNLLNQEQAVTFYSFFDPALNNDPTNDTETLIAGMPGERTFATLVTDPEPNGLQLDIRGRLGQGEVENSLSSHWELRNGNSIVTSLADNDRTFLADKESPVGPGNVQGAYSWSFLIAPDAMVLGVFSKTLSPRPVPEPDSVLLFSAGLLGLLGYGWLRRGK